MTNGIKKSDGVIIPKKVTNKGESSPAPLPQKVANKGQPAELLEGRTPTKRNSVSQSTGRTQKRRGNVSQAADRIRKFVKRNPKERLTALLGHVNPETLREAFFSLKANAAVGVDRLTWKEYAKNLDENLIDLHHRVRRGAYRATPVRRVYIDKSDGGKRPLGIPALEDKIVQKVVVDAILTPIYEEEFLGCSYGFRPGRSAHNALDAVTYGISRRPISWVLDADVKSYFDTVSRDRLIKFLEFRIGDKKLLRLITKWLNAGVMEDGIRSDTGQGTPQGAICSPILANIFMHYVLDLWFRDWRSKVPRGEAHIIRYADDFVLEFQYKQDAYRCLNDLRHRFQYFGLSLHPDKTRILNFGRFAAADRKKNGLGHPETFDFLGFTHFCTKTRQGKFRVGRKPIAKRMSQTLCRIGETLRKRMNWDIWEVGEWLGKVINGWLNYFAVPGSSVYLRRFVRRVQRRWMQVLRRRSQRGMFDWKQLERMTEVLWPRVSIRHPWPEQRIAVTYSR